MRCLLLNHFYPLLKQLLFFEASGAVAKICLNLNLTILNKIIFCKSLINNVQLCQIISKCIPMRKSNLQRVVVNKHLESIQFWPLNQNLLDFIVEITSPIELRNWGKNEWNVREIKRKKFDGGKRALKIIGFFFFLNCANWSHVYSWSL